MKYRRRLKMTTIGAFFSILSFPALASVEQWHPADLSFTSTTSFANPFLNVSLSAPFAGPGSTTLTVPDAGTSVLLSVEARRGLENAELPDEY